MPRSRRSSVNSDDDTEDETRHTKEAAPQNGDKDSKRSRNKKERKFVNEEGDTELAEKEMDTEYFMSIENMKWDEDEIDELKSMPVSERLYFPDAAAFCKEVELLERDRTVIMGPANMDDLSNPDIFDMLQTCKDFKLHFSKQSVDNDFKGYIRLVFNSELEAKQCAQNLANFRDDFSVLHLIPVDGKDVDANSVMSAAEYNDAKQRWVRVGVLTGIPRCITLEDVAEQFPDALHVWFPYSQVHKSRKWHAYIEFKTKEELDNLHHQVYMIGDDFKFKLMRMHEIPDAKELGQRIEETKKNIPSSGQMSTKSRIEMIKLLQYTRHYMTSEDCGVPKHEQSIMKTFNNMLRNKLNSDSRRRKDTSKSRDKDRDSSSNRSRATKRSNRSDSPRSEDKRPRQNSEGDRECYKCGKTGHIQRDCAQNPGGGSGCFKCGQNGHIARDCTQSLPGRDSGSGRSCYSCGGFGHMKKDCPLPMMSGGGIGGGGMGGGSMNSSMGGGGLMNNMGSMNSASGMDPIQTAAAVLMNLVGQQNSMGGGNMGIGSMGGSSMGGGMAGTMGGGMGSSSYSDTNMGGGGGYGGSTSAGSGYGNLGYSGSSSDRDRGSSGKSCFSCNSYDHIARDCPNGNSGGSGTTCYHCNQTGHYARDCPSKDKKESDYGRDSSRDRGKDCFNCGSTSHMKRDCPMNPKSSTNTSCYACGLTGHMKNECPTHSASDCFNCGESGHMARDCSRPRVSRNDRRNDDRERDRSSMDRPSYSTSSGSGARRDTGGTGSAARSDQCFHCGSSGHFARDCPVKEVGGRQRCFRCGEEGHMSRDCRQ